MKYYISCVHVAVVLALLVLEFSALSLRSGVFIVSGDDGAVLPTFGDADKALKRAFAAVLEAEAAGANVTGLLGELDVAGRNLTEAEMAYVAGNTSEAATRAGQCIALADAVGGEAADLKAQAAADGRVASWRVVSFSLVGVFVFLIVLVIAWVLFRRSYGARLLRGKPEVAG